jgi:ribosomal protein S18 acetylase RimI-like enzyme
MDLSKQIPEFENPFSLSEYENRCSGVTHLSLIAEIENQPAGFKIGYDRFKDGSFYSWMGGVRAEFRRNEIARELADYQENWAKENGFKYIKLKTRKKHTAMIAFSMDRGFSITAKEPKKDPNETRIWMEKKL